MKNVYDVCPVWQSERFLMRRATSDDAKELVKVYGDLNALPFMNSDNCNGDNFYYPTEAIMLEHIAFWDYAYEKRGFVRFSIVDRTTNEIIGTVELFNRQAEDAFHDCGLLRLDVRSDYERAESLSAMLDLIMHNAYETFDCDWIVTKAPLYAVERVKALTMAGYEKSAHTLPGPNGIVYGDYWSVRKA